MTVDYSALDTYDGKVRALEMIGQELLDKQQAYAEVSGRAAMLKAEISVLRSAQSAIQSALRAERAS